MKLLVLSNGHGEDIIAIRIIERLQAEIPELEVSVLPIVGQGHAYQQRNLALAGRVQQMPSGGFIYQGGTPLWQDLRGGLLSLTLEQLKLVRAWGRSDAVILAVGDLVPLLFAWYSGANYAFVGTAKSEYYLRDDAVWLSQTSWLEKRSQSVYLPWERWLMSQRRCQGVFPRDSLTSRILKKWSIPVYDLGNPMMDGFAINSHLRLQHANALQELNILLLPGSRMPEAIRNWQKILVAVDSAMQLLSSSSLHFYGAIAPGLELEEFLKTMGSAWELVQNSSGTMALRQGKHHLYLSQEYNRDYFEKSDLALAMAGTATEQFVGLGKPVVTFPGSGPQFTFAFAEAQSRLLGCSISLLEQPEEAGSRILELIQDPQLLAQITCNGQRRLGAPGAAARIASCLQKTLFSP